MTRASTTQGEPAAAVPEWAAAALGEAAGALRVEQAGGVVTVRLSRPDRHNAISYQMWTALARLMPLLGSREEVDVVVLTGPPGGPFSAGADIAEFQALRSDAAGAARYSAAVAAGEAAVADCYRPTVAVVEGFAIGGGSQLALACDLRLCDPGARFAITPARLGIVYGLDSTARLVEAVGAPWARWILLTGDELDAATALRVGLVHEVHAADRLPARVQQLTATLAARARVSLHGGKQLIARAAAGRVAPDPQVQQLYDASLHGPEYAEGVAAFLAKRPPDFPAARRAASGRETQ